MRVDKGLQTYTSQAVLFLALDGRLACLCRGQQERMQTLLEQIGSVQTNASCATKWRTIYHLFFCVLDGQISSL
jgi:hypothetical protein